MFDYLDSKDGVEKKVARHFSSSLQSSFIYRYCGSLKFKMDVEPVACDKIALFEETMASLIKERVKFNGYTSIREDLIEEVLGFMEVSYPDERRTGEVVYIEDDKAYSYVPGMNGARKI